MDNSLCLTKYLTNEMLYKLLTGVHYYFHFNVLVTCWCSISKFPPNEDIFLVTEQIVTWKQTPVTFQC